MSRDGLQHSSFNLISDDGQCTNHAVGIALLDLLLLLFWGTYDYRGFRNGKTGGKPRISVIGF